MQWCLRNPPTRSYGQKCRDSGCISGCLCSVGKLIFVEFVVPIDKVANKDFATILWKIVAESITFAFLIVIPRFYKREVCYFKLQGLVDWNDITSRDLWAIAIWDSALQVKYANNLSLANIAR